MAARSLEEFGFYDAAEERLDWQTQIASGIYRRYAQVWNTPLC